MIELPEFPGRAAAERALARLLADLEHGTWSVQVERRSAEAGLAGWRVEVDGPNAVLLAVLPERELNAARIVEAVTHLVERHRVSRPDQGTRR
jgi:hypothetical protein